MHDDLLDQARHLATRDTRRPKQANLRRAVSSAYYALFHLLVVDATRRVLGRSLFRYRRNDESPTLAASLHRAFTHESIKNASVVFAGGGTLPLLGNVQVPADLRAVAQAVVDLQQARHDADYDRSMTFKKTEVLDFVEEAEEARRVWRQVRRHDMARLYLLTLLCFKCLRDR